MSDKDLIIEFLEKAAKRVRSNKRFNEIAVSLSLALIPPVVFKLLDFVFLFRGRTVTAFFILWAVATVAWMYSRIRGTATPTAQMAARVDREAGLHDQLKTAYWFIRNPRQSEWVDAQIQRAATDTNRLQVDSLYPRRVPRTLYSVVALIILLVGLNFVPLSLNHNWLYLQAAPPFMLTDKERASLDNALKLLQQAKAAQNDEVVAKIEEIISNLEQGNISLDDAIKELNDLQTELEKGDAEAGALANGLQQMAAVLRQARALQQAARPMAQGDLGEAAAQMRALSERLETLTPDDLREMSQKLEEASENPRSSLQDLARAFLDTSSAIKRNDRAAQKAGVEKIAKALESVKQKIEDQELIADAGDELGDLVDALEQREGQSEGKAGEPGKSNQGKAGEKGAPQEAGGEAESEEGGGEPGESGQPGEGGEPGEAGEAGETPGGNSEDAPNGKGGNSYGGSTKSAPLEGDATSLEVQLQKEALKMEAEGGGNAEPEKNDEAAGERERSKLDYRNAPSDLTPAQKDLLNQERIPWENRQLIKNYFQAVKPKQTK